MQIILLSGGSGKRLWPLSNDIRSKQFIKIFHNAKDRESMIQRVYCKIRKRVPEASVIVATGKSQVSVLRNQLGDSVGISVEPFRRDTFPAIVLAAAYLHDEKDISENEAIVVCPVDPYVEDDYFDALEDLGNLAQEDNANLTLLGIEPTYPSEKYGYIIPESKEALTPVKTFKEKPDAKTAEEYINNGALWNAGIFAFRLGYILDKAHERIEFSDYHDLYAKYKSLEKISFDYAIAEQESSIVVKRFSGTWKDLGTWNTLVEAMDEQTIGQVTLDGTCSNIHVINNLDLPILGMGLKDMVIAAGPDGILVSDLKQSSYIRPYVEQIKQPIRYAEKSWGSYRVIDVEETSVTIRVTLLPGHQMNYHSHDRRDEVWTVVAGTGKTIVDGMEQEVRPGDVVTMQAGCRHTLINTGNSELQVIEVQLGQDIDVADKHKFRLEN